MFGRIALLNRQAVLREDANTHIVFDLFAESSSQSRTGTASKAADEVHTQEAVGSFDFLADRIKCKLKNLAVLLIVLFSEARWLALTERPTRQGRRICLFLWSTLHLPTVQVAVRPVIAAAVLEKLDVGWIKEAKVLAIFLDRLEDLRLGVDHDGVQGVRFESPQVAALLILQQIGMQFTTDLASTLPDLDQ